jgi:hypothetical protein
MRWIDWQAQHVCVGVRFCDAVHSHKLRQHVVLDCAYDRTVTRIGEHVGYHVCK